MKMITAAQAAAFAGGTVVGDGNTQITGISTDSRSIPAGSLFIPIRGERFDGHDFLEKAVELQAAAVMSEKDVDLPVPVIRVPDTRAALLALAGGYRSLFDIPVVGITGSVGKTTTKEMTAAVVGQKFRTLYTQGNLNNEIGMPLTLFRLEESTQAAVVEMGMSNFKEISRMTVQASAMPRWKFWRDCRKAARLCSTEMSRCCGARKTASRQRPCISASKIRHAMCAHSISCRREIISI